MDLKKAFFRKKGHKQEDRNVSFMLAQSPYRSLSANKNTTVIACKNMLIDSVSNLPVRLYRRDDSGGRIRATDHPYFDLFEETPDGRDPAKVYISRVMDLLIEEGNCFVFKLKKNGRIASLPILSQSVEVKDIPLEDRKYIYVGKEYTSQEILHIPGKYYNGLKGKSLTSLAADAVSLGNRLNEYTQYHFDNMINGGRLSIDLTDYANKNHIDTVEEVQDLIDELQKLLIGKYSGEENAGKSLILPPGVKADQLESASNLNNQLAQLRELQERFICQVFDIPYDIFTGENKYNSLEQRNELFKNRTLQFWTNRITDYLNLLLSPAERKTYYFEFDYNAFLKTDKKSRTENEVKQLINGILTINEIREMENLPAIDPEIGNVRFVGNTSIPLTKENIEAYFAKSKLALLEGTNHLKQGDDKE